MLLALGSASAAWANAAAPTNTPAQTSTVIDNSNGTVTVRSPAHGYGSSRLTPKTTQGIDVTAADPCDDRFGVGWAVIWNDPNDPGYPRDLPNGQRKGNRQLGVKEPMDGNAQGSVLWDKYQAVRHLRPDQYSR